MTMDLSTTYLGLRLPHPFVPGASPLVDDLDTVRRLEDAGAAAIVMHSLFEEQIAREQMATARHLDAAVESAEALTYLPDTDAFALGPEEYLEHIHKLKAVVSIPVIASLNGATEGGWLGYARLIENAGADALELNVYALAADPWEGSREIESRTLAMVRALREAAGVPVTVKLSPFYTAFAQFARQLDQAGADGLILFNRFYQPDLDVEELDVRRTLHLSDPAELPLRLRWLAILSGHVEASLVATGGVHSSLDVVKAVMAGAHAVQMVSALLRHGPEHLRAVLAGLELWMSEHGYESVEAMCGVLSLARCPDPAAYERANYLQIL